MALAALKRRRSTNDGPERFVCRRSDALFIKLTVLLSSVHSSVAGKPHEASGDALLMLAGMSDNNSQHLPPIKKRHV